MKSPFCPDSSYSTGTGFPRENSFSAISFSPRSPASAASNKVDPSSSVQGDLVLCQASFKRYTKQPNEYTCAPTSLKICLEDLKNSTISLRYLSKLLETDYSGTRNLIFERALPKIGKRFEVDYLVGEGATLDQLSQMLKERYLVIVNFIHPLEQEGHFAPVRALDSHSIHFVDPLSGPDFPIVYHNFLWRGEEGSVGWFAALRNKKLKHLAA